MPETVHLTCIGCPMSCPLELTVVAGEIREIKGYACKRGEEYARQEYSAPCRMVCTTVACNSGCWPRLPVRTVTAVPKEKVIAVARELHRLQIELPVTLGQTVCHNVAGTGVDVIATRSLPANQPEQLCLH